MTVCPSRGHKGRSPGRPRSGRNVGWRRHASIDLLGHCHCTVCIPPGMDLRYVGLGVSKRNPRCLQGKLLPDSGSDSMPELMSMPSAGLSDISRGRCASSRLPAPAVVFRRVTCAFGQSWPASPETTQRVLQVRALPRRLLPTLSGRRSRPARRWPGPSGQGRRRSHRQ